MKSISLTSSAKVFFSLLAAAFCAQGVLADGENYSLWPRRPEALAEARRLMDRGSLPKALELLQPLAEQGGVVGKEAKELIGRLRIRQLLDPNGPDVKKYTVRKGDSWIRMVRKLGCSQAMVVHLNGLMDIPALHAGDVFKYRPLDFHVVVNVPEKEICLYDGTDFVKGYPILSMKDGGKKNVETTVKDEQAPVSIYSRQFPSADKTLVLAAGGYVIDAARGTPRSPGFYLSRQDCNELADQAGNEGDYPEGERRGTVRLVIQRVSKAAVHIGGVCAGAVGPGLLILAGIEEADTEEDVRWLANKAAAMRIFSDADGKMNLSVREVSGSALVVSQFTLHASTRKGNRPSFIRAARPERAIPLYELFKKELASLLEGRVESGEFGADMQVSLINDGPVTIFMDSRKRE